MGARGLCPVGGWCDCWSFFACDVRRDRLTPAGAHGHLPGTQWLPGACEAGGGDRGGRRHRAWRRLVVRMVRLGRDGLNLRILERQGEYDESTLDDFTDAVGPRGQHCRADAGSLLPELRGCPERIGGSANSSYAKPRTNTGLRSRHLLYGERERVGHNAHRRGARPAGDQPDGNAMRSG